MNTDNREYLRSVSHRQLEIMVRNRGYINELLRDRLFLITGCRDFGGQDGTNGSCVECFYHNPELHNRCCLFQMTAHNYILQKHSQNTVLDNNKNESQSF